MSSSPESPSKLQSLEIRIIIHSLRINTIYSKYQVQVKCENLNKKETNKMKKNENSDVVFFESTLEFFLKSFDQEKYNIKFNVLEFVEGEPKKNGNVKVEYSGDIEKIEFQDIKLRNCSDSFGIICISVSCIKKLFPSLSLSDNTADQSVFEAKNEKNIEDYEENYIEERLQVEDDSGSIGNQDAVVPPISLNQAVLNSKSNPHYLEQSEPKPENTDNKCNCCCTF